MNPTRLFTQGLLAFVAGISIYCLTGCDTFSRQHGRSSSVVSFLYPKNSSPIADQTIPVLHLPLRVGIAFVPPNTARDGNYSYGDSGLTELQKTRLMQKVRDSFKAYPFVQSIEIVPSTYLRSGGGFANLDQLHGLLGIDVVVLLAYDQVQFTNDSFLSLAYWTIVGAYVVEANKNDTHTMMEAAVYDIPSRHLLFRAPGASQIKGRSTAVAVEGELRKSSGDGFDEAILDLNKNLDAQLAEFRERVKKAPGEVQIVNKPGYSGGGTLDGFSAALFGCFALALLCHRRKR
jgi:rhombotail lipoprotein